MVFCILRQVSAYAQLQTFFLFENDNSVFLKYLDVVFLLNSKGMRTYAPGWQPPTEALFQSIKSYQNRDGVFIHGTRNLRINDAFIARNANNGVVYFGNGNNNIIEDSTIIGD